MFNSIAEKVYMGLAVAVIAAAVVMTAVGCGERSTTATEPAAGPENIESHEASAGELHNMIIKEYLAAVLENGRLEETGGRIPWEEAKKLFLHAGNRVLREQGADFRITEEILEERMHQLAELKRKGIIDVFYPERNNDLPAVLAEMARNNIIPPGRAERVAGFWNRNIDAIDAESRDFQSVFALEIEDASVLSVIEHSNNFWTRVTEEDLVAKEDDEESDDSFWDNIHDWWLRNRKDIRRITIASCDAGGAAAGVGLGPAGVVAGSMLASSGAVIAWPPYDSSSCPEGGELNWQEE
ncbi:MAG: hypothetical protein R6U43_10980 [Candidatus Krumholzibacteriales bacterium]